MVKQGDFVAYPLADVHLNPKYYPEPHKYDPGRWLRPDPVPDAIYPFLGWGAGRHPYTGMKLAKLEMKLILALFLTRYEFDLVDKTGKFPNPLPVPDRNDMHRVRAELWKRLPVDVHPVPPTRLGSSPWSYILLQFQGGCAIDELLPVTFEPFSPTGFDLFLHTYMPRAHCLA